MKLYISITTLLLFFILASCNSSKNEHSEGDGHDHSTENNEHENENEVMLSDEQMKSVGIELGQFEEKEMAAIIKANGFLKVPNNNKANATSLYGGLIKNLYVEIGSSVRKGQVIATITNPQFIQQQEDYLNTMTQIELAQQEMTRQRDLNEGNVGAKKNLQAATAELNTLKTRFASLREQIRLMGMEPSSLSNTNLKTSISVLSPINGVVSAVFSKMGSYVDVSSPIIEIVENSAVHLDLQVFEIDIPKISQGQKIEFVLTNLPNKTYTAEVYNIGSTFDNNSKTIAIHSRILGDKTGLIDGMNITGAIRLGAVKSLTVPNEAIVNADGKYYIFTVKEKQEEPHDHQEGESHDHSHEHDNDKGTTFEKIEIIKGTTLLGYTAITATQNISKDAHIAVKGAFFINAKLTNSGDGHAH